MLARILVVTCLASLAIALAVGWRMRRRRVAVRLLAAVAGALATTVLIWALVVGAFLAALFEPWPLALRQGPDTEFSRLCYAEFLGEAPPANVTGIYCRKEWGFGGDSIYSIRFAFRASSTVHGIVERRQMDAVPELERERVRYLSGPRWWPPKERLSRAWHIYERRRIEFLWVDPESMEAFYQLAQF